MTPRLVGLLFSGFACRAYAAGLAVWVVVETLGYVHQTFALANAALVTLK
jgi:hypothetical protein